jgi:hypothetical protein
MERQSATEAPRELRDPEVAALEDRVERLETFLHVCVGLVSEFHGYLEGYLERSRPFGLFAESEDEG